MPVNPPVNPLKALTLAVSKKIALELDLRGITTPGGDDIDLNQNLVSQFRVGWSNLSSISLIENVTYRVETVKIEVALSFKDLKLTDKAQDFLFQALILLSGYKPYQIFSKLVPVSCGYVGYDPENKLLKYAATFNTTFEWIEGKPIEIIDYDPEIKNLYGIVLELWNSPTLEQNNQSLDYLSEEYTDD